MSYELRNRPRSLPSHYGSVVEHWSAESEGLRFDSSLGLAIFSLSHTHDIMEKNLSPPANTSLAFAPLYHVDE